MFLLRARSLVLHLALVCAAPHGGEVPPALQPDLLPRAHAALLAAAAPLVNQSEPTGLLGFLQAEESGDAPLTLAFGVAFDSGRLSQCTVCLDGMDMEGRSSPPNGVCEPWEPQTRTRASGEYLITSPPFVFSLDAVPKSGGPPARAAPSSRGAAALAAATLLLQPGGDCINEMSRSPVRAHMRCANLLDKTASGEVVSNGGSTCSPLTDLAHRVEARTKDANEAADVLARVLDLSGPMRGLAIDPTTMSDVDADNWKSLRVVMTLRQIEVWEDVALATLYPAQPLPAVHGAPFRELVLFHVRERMASLVQAPSGALDLASPEQLAGAMAAAAAALRLNVSSDVEDKLLAAAMAASRLARIIAAQMPSPRSLAEEWPFQASPSGGVSAREWLAAQRDFSRAQQVGLWLAGEAARLGSGLVDVVNFSSATSNDAMLAVFERTPAARVELGCMDAQAASHDFSATLHRPASCFYADSSFWYHMLSMSAAAWCYFLFTLVANLWLLMTWAGALKFQCKMGRMVSMARAPIKLPRVAVFIPCYMPNEASIILETLEHMTASEYDGQLDFYVVYNTPVDLPIEHELAKLTSMNGRKVHCQRVPGSKSKADNLEYGLLHFTEKGSVCVLFDADHHPRKDTIRGLVAVLLQSPDVVAVQGAVLIERGGPWLMRRLLDGMEWSSWSFYAPGFAELVGSAYFGGGNAAWRVETLHAIGFDNKMLTEDIDISIRTLAAGYKMLNAPFLQVGEMCPQGLTALYKQRLRWAMGWEQVTMQRIALLLSSPHITEPRKWRVMGILISRYITLISSAIGVFNLMKSLFFNFYTPVPCEWMVRCSMLVTLLMVVMFTTALLRQKEPWQRWVSVYAFAALSLFYFFIQLLLIVVAILRLTCCASRSILWVPTSRGKDSSNVPPPALETKR